MLEVTVEDYLCERVKQYGGRCDKVINQSRRGCPDREVQHDVVGIDKVELKKPGGTPESHQTRYHQFLAKCGVPVYVLDTTEKVDEYFYHRLVHQRGHLPHLFSVPVDDPRP